MNKRGVSEVIVSVLLVLVVISSILVLWVAAEPTIKKVLRIGNNSFQEEISVALSGSCSDGTLAGACSSQGLYCAQGVLVEDCRKCGTCSSGTCNTETGKCEAEIGDEEGVGTLITECGTISVSGNYYLDGDLISSGNCLTITAADVIIRGNGKKIIGDNTGEGIYYNKINVSILNINISHFSNGIHLGSEAKNSVVSNNKLSSNSNIGVLNEGSYNKIANNYFNSNINTIYLHYGASYNTLENNLIENTGYGHGIIFNMNANNNLLRNNFIKNSQYIALMLYESRNNLVYDGTFTGNKYDIYSDGALTSINNSLINCSYDLTKERVGSGNEIIRKWYVDVTTAPSQTVSSAESYLGSTVSKTSDASGKARLELINYVNNGGTVSDYKTHTVSSGANSQVVDVDSNKNIVLESVPSTNNCFNIADNPIKICTCNDLQRMNEKLNGNYELQNNIDCSDTVNWNDGKGFEPVGDGSNKFTGNLNGKGFTINNLYIYRPSQNYVGLFGWAINSGFSNIGLVNVNITGNIFVGGLVAIQYESLSSVSNSYTTGYVTASMDSVGGLVAWCYHGTISDSYSTAIVRSLKKSGGDSVAGGLVGDNGAGIIKNSFSTGSVSGISLVGGLVGKQSSGTITNSYWYNSQTNCYSGGDTGCIKATAISDFYNGKAPTNVWDTNIWEFYSDKLPTLKWQGGREGGCLINNVYFTTDINTQRDDSFYVNEGDVVYLVAEGSNCDGMSAEIELKEDDLISNDLVFSENKNFENGKISLIWNVQYVDELFSDAEYFFDVSMGENSIRSENEVYVKNSNDFAAGVWCYGADINRDKVVSLADINILSGYETSGIECNYTNYWCDDSDINMDGKVNQTDRDVVIYEFGRTDKTECTGSCRIEEAYFTLDSEGAKRTDSFYVFQSTPVYLIAKGKGCYGPVEISLKEDDTILDDLIQNETRTFDSSGTVSMTWYSSHQKEFWGDAEYFFDVDGVRSENMIYVKNNNDFAAGEWCNGADIDRNGTVNSGDVDFISDYISRGVIGCNEFNNMCNRTDITHDGIVDSDDLSIVTANIGREDCAGSENSYSYYEICNDIDCTNSNDMFDISDGSVYFKIIGDSEPYRSLLYYPNYSMESVELNFVNGMARIDFSEAGTYEIEFHSMNPICENFSEDEYDYGLESESEEFYSRCYSEYASFEVVDTQAMINELKDIGKIDSCTEINESGDYFLGNDISSIVPAGFCINITARGVTFDCRWHKVESPEGIPVVSSQTDTDVFDCGVAWPICRTTAAECCDTLSGVNIFCQPISHCEGNNICTASCDKSLAIGEGKCAFTCMPCPDGRACSINENELAECVA